MRASCKKSACTLEDESTHLVEGSADRSDPTTDISRDPAMEHKILSKIEALRERLVQWTRRLNESVYLNKIQRKCYSAYRIQFHTVQHTLHFLHSSV